LSESNKIPVTGYAVFCGLDVGKAEHHACALNAALATQLMPHLAGSVETAAELPIGVHPHALGQQLGIVHCPGRRWPMTGGVVGARGDLHTVLGEHAG